jgi:hypothetical protein
MLLEGEYAHKVDRRRSRLSIAGISRNLQQKGYGLEPPGTPGPPGKAISRIFFPGVPGVVAVDILIVRDSKGTLIFTYTA